MFRIAHAGVLLTLLAIAGCQLPPMAEPDRTEVGDATEEQAFQRNAQGLRLMALLYYHERIEQLDTQTLQRRREILEQRLQPGRCSTSRIRLAMLISHTRPEDPPTGDEILDPCIRGHDANDTAEHLLAPLLQDLLTARRARAHTDARAQELEQQLTQTRSEIGKLQEQLDGLKAIEESLKKRGTPEEE